jgi:hypothetical protein
MGNRVEVDWGRMARPQVDHYDLSKIIELAEAKWGWKKRLPVEGEPSMFGGNVPLVHYPQKPTPDLENAPFNSPNIMKTELGLMQVWPEAVAMMQALCNEIWILRDVNYGDVDNMCGCTCGNQSGFGEICTTIQGVIGFMHGCVHEIGHWKLKAMGVDLMSWGGPIVANDPEDRYDSPVRKDITRPMGAVLHAQYSYLHVLEMEIRAWRLGLKSDMLSTNVARMDEGRCTLKHWETAPEGKPFRDAVMAWADELVEAGRQLPE